nr:hypothetical protein [Vagococcus fluvialis]
MNVNTQKTQIIKDSLLNIIASLLFTLATQLIVYPLLGKELSPSEFGIVLTVVGLINAFGVIFGGSLNNIHLINNTNKNISEIEYKILLKQAIFINTIIITVSLLFFIANLTLSNFLLLIITCNFILLRSYLTVYFRININYVQIFFHMLMTSLGYVIGIVFFYFIKNWAIIFFVGELISLLYLKKYIKTSTKNQVIKSENFKKLQKDYINLASSNSISNLMLYLDRLLLTPLLGPENVGVFFAASLFGKMAGIVLQPLSGVVLTYISSKNKLSKRSIYKILLFVSVIFGLFIFIFSVYATPVFINIFYPDFSEDIIDYYILANLASIILIMSNLLQPLTLKYCNIKWQIVIQGVYGFLYLLLGIALTISFGLLGFVYAVLISNISRFVIINLLLFIKLKGEQND